MSSLNLLIKASMVIIFCYSHVSAQTLHESMNTFGASFAGSGGSASQSAGQVFYTIVTGAGGSANQGIHQPYEISVVTKLKDGPAISLTIAAFPNPTTGLLRLSIDNQRFEGLNYQFFEGNGKLLETGEISGTETGIDLTFRAQAVYFLKVLRHNETLKTFKIVKSH